MKNILVKIFSYNGKFERKEYILIGCILPIALIIIGSVILNLLKPLIGSPIIVILIGLSIIFSIALSSSIKRARAKASHTSLIQIIMEVLNIS